MTEHDELSRLARAITEAEDALNESNHRDECQQLAQMDETRSHLVERIAAREKALDVARAAFMKLAQEMAREGAVKVEIESMPSLADTSYDLEVVPSDDGDDAFGAGAQWSAELITRALQREYPSYSNGLDGHEED